MSDPKDEKPAAPPDIAGQEPKQSGRISRDSRGNAVWEWEMQTGVFGRDVSTQRLKKLEAHDLAILETGAHPQQQPQPKKPAVPDPQLPQAKPGVMPAKGSGFNPYDSSTAGGSYRPPAPSPLEEKPKRRSIQSIVADQLAKNKKR